MHGDWRFQTSKMMQKHHKFIINFDPCTLLTWHDYIMIRYNTYCSGYTSAIIVLTLYKFHALKNSLVFWSQTISLCEKQDQFKTLIWIIDLKKARKRAASTVLNIFLCVPWRKVIQVFTDMRVSQCWLNYNFGVN